MTKRDLVVEVSRRTGDTQKSCDDIIVAACNIIVEALMSGDFVQIRNFCTFECMYYAERTAVNPRTGMKQYFPAIKVPTCRMADVVNTVVRSGRTKLGRDLVT